jgi:hypothetical protein
MRCIRCDSLASPSSLLTHSPCKPRYPRLVFNIISGTTYATMLGFNAVHENWVAMLDVKQQAKSKLCLYRPPGEAVA